MNTAHLISDVIFNISSQGAFVVSFFALIFTVPVAGVIGVCSRRWATWNIAALAIVVLANFPIGYALTKVMLENQRVHSDAIAEMLLSPETEIEIHVDRNGLRYAVLRQPAINEETPISFMGKEANEVRVIQAARERYLGSLTLAALIDSDVRLSSNQTLESLFLAQK